MDPSQSSQSDKGFNFPVPMEFSANQGVSNDTGAEVKYLFDLLKNGEKAIELRDEYRNAVLVLGNTGSGKTTFTQWVAGDNSKLIAREVTEGSGEFIIDDYNRIGNSTIQSKTIFPELVIDAKSNTAYYDCPGFSDTRGMSNDIATTYFIKRVLDFAGSIKMIFTINHSSVRKGVDRQDFMNLVRHVTEFVKDIDKFQNSIGIVATKVDNQYIKQGKSFVLVEDNVVVGAIANFLQEVKQDLERIVKDPPPVFKDQTFYKNAIRFLDVLLVKDRDHYSKIGIFRRPNEPGPLSNITLLQEGKNSIEKILYENLNFTAINPGDFGYTVSDRTKKKISYVVEEINESVSSSISHVIQEMQHYYGDIVKQVCDKIKVFVTGETDIDVRKSEAREFSSQFRNGHSIALRLVEVTKNLTNLEELAGKINNSLTDLDFSVSENDILNISNQGQYFNFLQVISDKELSTRRWADIFEGNTAFFSESRNNVERGVNQASEKINNRIQSELDAAANSIREHFDSQMKLLTIQRLPDKLRKGYDDILNMAKRIENATMMKELSRAIKSSADNLDINFLNNLVVNIISQEQNFEFLQAVSDEELKLASLAWSLPFVKVAKHLDESKKWYVFLNDLYVKFSEYYIQKNRRRYNVAAIEDWGKIGKPQGLVITENTFDQFLNQTAEFNIREYESVKTLPVSDLKIEELNSVLNFTLKHEVRCHLAEPYLFIKGNYIDFQFDAENVHMDGSCKDIPLALSSGKYKFINVFALDSVFFDQDVTSRGLKLPIIVIAPRWEIVGKRLIDLTGADGEPHADVKAKDGIYLVAEGRGEDGKPGRAGGPGGVFFGIADEIVNGEDLTITVNGGRGGSGQNGGDGRRGKDGHNLELKSIPGYGPNPPYQLIADIKDTPCRDDYKQIGGYKSHLLFYNRIWRGWGDALPPVTCKYKIFGVPGDRGGDGGNGGRAGKGGNLGSVTLFHLSDSVVSRKYGLKGEDGKNGLGGRGGIGGKNGDDVTGISHTGDNWMKWWWEDRVDNKRARSGRNGSDGASILGRKEPQEAFVFQGEEANIINEYKSYLRESLDDRFKNYFLMQFFNKLEGNENVKKLYSTLGLVNELQGLEKQFHNLNRDLDLTHFYESLLKRISEYALSPKDSEKSSEYKKVLGYLYTATLGRMYDLKNNLASNLIIDISRYLDLVNNNIVILKDLKKVNNKADVIHQQKRNYKYKMDQKIIEAQNFVRNQIEPNINSISYEIDSKIDLLIDETIELQKQAKQEKEDLIQKKKELEKALAYRELFNCFKVIGQVIGFIGPVGAVVGTVIGTATTVTESLVLDNEHQKIKIPKSVSSNLRSLGDQIKTVRNRKINYLNKLLDEMSQELNEHPNELNDVSLKLTEIKTRLHKLSEKKFDFKDVAVFERELKQTLNSKQDELKFQKDVTDTKTERALKVIEKFNRIVDIGSVLVDIHKKFQNDKAKIDAIANAIEEAENKFEKLKQYEETITNTISPMLQNMEESLRDVANKLETKSQVALDVIEWQVQSTLKDMKLQMQQLTQGFDVKDNLARCIEKLEEVMTTLINVYDRIQNYQEQQDLSNFIADISSTAASSISINDPTLTNAVNHLDMLIRSNIVLKQYKAAVDAFNQWVFPFADHFLEDLVLPHHLELEGNIETTVSKAVTQIENMKSKVGEYKVSVRMSDKYIQSGEFNSKYISTQPFFVWRNEEYKNTISELLSGKEVVLKADVRNSAYYKDAIKFSLVEFYFKSKNETLQSAINDTLKGFDIRATHLGNSYYRYGGNIYLITSESQTIGYSFQTNAAEEPVRKNRVYQKIKKGNLMLSPYTSWEIKIINATSKISFEELEIFKEDIDIELSGYGSYVDREISEFKIGSDEYKAIETKNELKCTKCRTNRNDSPLFNRRYVRSIDENERSSNFMTNKASSVVSSPINSLCNFLKLHVMSIVLNSVNLVLFGKKDCVKFVTENKNNYKVWIEDTISEESTSQNTLPSLAKGLREREGIDPRTTADSVPFFKKDDSQTDEKINELNFIKISTVNCDDLSNYLRLSSPNGRQSIRITQLNQAPEINSSLLLADLITRTVTRTKYKASIHESLFSQKEVVARKISNGIIENEYDLLKNLHGILTETENDIHCSWFCKVKAYAESTLKFLGFVREEDVDDYAHDLSLLFT